MAVRLASFRWPLVEVAEVKRLLRYAECRVYDVAVCEFTGVVRTCNERLHGRPTLSVDTRTSLIPGVHACLDARLVLPLRPQWGRIYGFPPCTHQTLSDTTARLSKQMDHRAFWGILFFLWIWCVACQMMMLEQPDTIIPDYFQAPSQRFRTSELGCVDDKQINLYERRRCRLRLTHLPGGRSGHGRFHDFRNADERDRHRSSWQRFPELVSAVVAAPADEASSVETPSFEDVREAFAVAWHQAGYPVPWDYEAPDAQPTEAEARAYQRTRGKGDGRRPPSVLPRSLRSQEHQSNLLDVVAEQHALTTRFVHLASLTAHAFILFFVAMQTTPLVLAPLNGLEVIGAEFHVSAHRRAALTVASRWSRAAAAAPVVTLLVGEYNDGARLTATPLALTPPAGQVVRTPAQRRRLALSGTLMAWCTLSALAGTVAYDPAARAVAACNSLRMPVAHLADAAIYGHAQLGSFTFGMFSTRPLLDRLHGLPTQSLAPLSALARVRAHSDLLGLSLRALGDEDSSLWADVIRPEELQDVPPGFFERLPTFADARLDQLALTAPWVPPAMPRLERRPSQPPVSSNRCPRSPFDLMPAPTVRRMRSWMSIMLADLVCVRDLGELCERKRPGVFVVSQLELYEWARGVVWDFRQAPSQCAQPLDYNAPLQPTLNSDFFASELRDYPNQRILGMIETGVIYQADVELQAVFVPHLTSLPKGFKAVSKELRRLGNLRWYEHFPHAPFFPGYYNGQGTTPRKLEVGRDRRTTEGGGPRKQTWDRSGLEVISINDASKTYHLPQHYLSDQRDEMKTWMASRSLPPTAAQLAALKLNRGTKWARQHMPTIRDVMHDLCVLSRASRRLKQPIYVFGNDVKDYFNHLENDPSELPLMNVAWIDDDMLEADARQRAYSDESGNALVFISERRMGFGIHPNSGIAQELSEAVDYIFRKRMDAYLEPLLEQSSDTELQQWLHERQQLQRRVGGHQSRLYASHTYCDDNIIIVVGVMHALEAIKLRRQIEIEAGLIMAIPEKRMLGTWGVWLGIYIFAGLGLVVIPRSKLVRASSALRRAVDGHSQFDEYQSLTGLLEHIRHASCMPRRLMHGLYRPHGREGEGRFGPSTLVRPTLFMAHQLMGWLTLLASTAGAVVTDVLRKSAVSSASRLLYAGSSDAATDSTPPGIGGFMHGMYWYLALSAVHVHWLHVSVLEMLATGFSAMIFHPHVPPTAALSLAADASATATSLTLHSQSSEMLAITHHELTSCPAFQRAEPHTELGHVRGDSNELADVVSRGRWDAFFQICKQMRIRPHQLAFTDPCQNVLDRVLQRAMHRGVPVRPNPYQHDADPPLPHELDRYLTAEERHLGKRCRCCDMGDGPVLQHLPFIRQLQTQLVGPAVRQRLASDLRRAAQQLQDARIQTQRCRFHMDDVLDSISQERLKGDHARLALASLKRGLQGQRPSSQQLHDVFEVQFRYVSSQRRLKQLARAQQFWRDELIKANARASDAQAASDFYHALNAASTVLHQRATLGMQPLPDPLGPTLRPVFHLRDWALPRHMYHDYDVELLQILPPSLPSRSLLREIHRDNHDGLLYRPDSPMLAGQPARLPSSITYCKAVDHSLPPPAAQSQRTRHFEPIAVHEPSSPLAANAPIIVERPAQHFMPAVVCLLQHPPMPMDGRPRMYARMLSLTDKPTLLRATGSWTSTFKPIAQHAQPDHLRAMRMALDQVPTTVPIVRRDMTYHQLFAILRRRRQLARFRSLTGLERGISKARSDSTDGDGPPSQLRHSYDHACDLVRQGDPLNPSYELLKALRIISETAGREVVRSPRTSTLAAIHAVLHRHTMPAAHKTDQECWQHFGASRTNFQSWKRKLAPLAPVAVTSVSDAQLPPLSLPQPSASGLCLPDPLPHLHLVANELRAAMQLPPPSPTMPLPPPLPSLLEQHPRPPTPHEMRLDKAFSSSTQGDGPGRYAAAKASAGSRTFCNRPPSSTVAGNRSRYWLATHVQLPAPAPETGAAAPAAVPRRAPASSRAPVRSAKRMSSVSINGERFAVPAERRARATSLRKLAMLGLAHERATRMTPATANEDTRASLAAAVAATHELAEHGAADGTLDIDDLAWSFWDRFCKLYEWSPTFEGNAEWARTHGDEISQRLAIFQAWVYPQLAGRGGRADAKPRTVFNNYVLAVLRVLSREHVPMPKAKHVEKNLAGLMRSFKQIYGEEVLMPGRKQPFTPSMWANIESMPEGTKLDGRPDWSPSTRLRDRTLLRLGRVLWRTGHRLGEITWHRSGEINYLTRKSVSIRKNSGRAISRPTSEDWRNLAPGDVVWLAPCVSKSDQFGEEHCPFPSVLPYNGGDDSAAASIRDIELEQPCAADDRWRTPLFGDHALEPFTYAVLHGELRRLLTALYGARFASAFSWHSIRIGLACALHAADCPDAVIQLICRWANPASLKVYRQMGMEKHIFWTDKARATTFDAARVNNIPVLDNDDRMARNVHEFAPDMNGRDNAPDGATTPRRAPLPPSQQYAIPGGTVLACKDDDNGLVGLTVGVFNNLWPEGINDFRRTPCLVVARCAREFKHPDNQRCLTYLIEYNGRCFPIKHSGLLDSITQVVRRGLPTQRGL